jgi:hypothetical protein
MLKPLRVPQTTDLLPDRVMVGRRTKVQETLHQSVQRDLSRIHHLLMGSQKGKMMGLHSRRRAQMISHLAFSMR